MTAFASRLKDLRKKKKISQAQLAKELGVTQQTVCMWERGRRRPPISTISSIADLFDVKPSFLIGNRDDSSVSESSVKAAKEHAEKDDRELEHLTCQLTQLSYDSRRIIAAALAEAYRRDRKKGQLQPADAHVISVKSKSLISEEGKGEK